MRKTKIIGLSVLIFTSFLFCQFSGGNGTESDPYQITTASELDSIRYYLDAHFILLNDIDLSVFLSEGNPGFNSGAFWNPIGTSGDGFTGSLNGNSKKITNLKINRPSGYYIGLFGYIGYTTANAVVNNLILETDSISGISGNGYAGGLAGISYNSNITECHFSGIVSGTTQTGGLIGWASQCLISSCSAKCNTSGSECTGCLIGENYLSTVSECYSEGFSAGISSYTGGLIGKSNGSVNDCYSLSSVSGTNYTGGLLGSNSGNANNCYSIGLITSDNLFVGGLVGENTGSILNSYWNTETSGQSVSSGGVGKTTADMMLQSIYTSWDFETPIWVINHFNNNYPHLKWDTNFIFTGGNGSEIDPFQIYSADEMNSVRNYLDKNFILMGNIDLSLYLTEGNPGYNEGLYWEPVGNDSTPFCGTFSGNEHKITGLKIFRPDSWDIGLFGNTECALVKDLKVEVDKAVKVTGKDQVGSLIGNCRYSSVINCSSLSAIEGEGNAGGLIGYCDSSSVSYSKSEGNVKGSSGIGGLIGATYRSEIKMCSSAGSVEGRYEFAGGLIGICSGKVEASYSSCSVSGTDLNSGGLTGGNWPCDLTNCYATGSVSGVSGVGGLSGAGNGTMSNCYSKGEVSGSTETGGLLGAYSGTVNNSFWDIQTSNQLTSAGGEGKITAEMMDVGTYSNWDFLTPIWEHNSYLNKGYPFLSWDDNFHFAGGNGTPENPFLVSNADELDKVRNCLEANFLQTADIDLSEYANWNQIGYMLSDTEYEFFYGSYDGNGFAINNLNIDKSGIDCLGLFGYIYNSTLKNIKIYDASITGDSQYTGILAGIAFVSNIDSCFTSGFIYGRNNTGGLIGSVFATSVSYCATSTNVLNTEDYAGGLIGLNKSNSLVKMCSSSGNVRSSGVTGGLVGSNSDKSKIEESFSNSSVYCYNHSAGGLIGILESGSVVNKSFSTGDITGSEVNMFFGGMIGITGDSCIVSNCYSRGNVDGYSICGGFTSSASLGSQLSHCYSTGNVNGGSQIGGFIGYKNSGALIDYCYWDIETSGQTTSDGGEGRSTDDMTYEFNEGTYVNWDFADTWEGSYNNNDAYPHLAWQGLTGIHEENTIPQFFSLYQNYPNPFNPATVIKFSLADDSKVKLSVYNTKGQLVRTLIDGKTEKGYHTVNFLAEGLNSGVYFCRLDVGGSVRNMKMLLVK